MLVYKLITVDWDEHTGVPKPCEENQACEVSKFARLRKGAIHLLGPTKRKMPNIVILTG